MEPLFLIWSMEHDAWWAPGEIGYAPVIGGAGRYSRADAERIVRRANIVRCHECMIPESAIFSPLGADSAISAADLEELRHEVTQGAGHECSEWAPHGLCLLCGRLVQP